MSLNGTQMLVTGGAGGIGRAIVSAGLAAGARVTVWDRASAGPHGADFAQVDLTSEAQVQAAFEALAARQALPQVVVNAVGVFTHLLPLEALGHEAFLDVLRTNLGAYFLVCREAIRRQSDGLAIVNVSSSLSQRPIPLASAYCASKAAIDSLTRSIAVEYGPKGVRANAVNPGPVGGALLDRGLEEIAGLLGCTPEDVRQQILAVVPLGRLVESREVAAATLFLASPEAAAINGQTLNVSGTFAM